MDDFQFQPDEAPSFGNGWVVGSRVTDREGKKGGDKSVTVSEAEKEILLRHHANFPRMSLGKAEARGEKVEFEFRLFPNGETVGLKINHPKATGQETRIYFRSGIFYPAPHDFWFLMEREGEVWIGTLSDAEFALAKSGSSLDLQNGADAEFESVFQDAVNGSIPKLVSGSITGYRRDYGVARRALEASGYTCELMPGHETFTSKSTGKPYLEAHHFVPIFEQRNFHEHGLDVEQNICILNPYAHKLLHHATYSEAKPYLMRLAEKREQFLNAIDIDIDRVLRSYGGP